MFLFTKESLEKTKYQDLVKLAKEHGVYRRYASKAEIIEKLSSVPDVKEELLDDIPMPSVMVDDNLDLSLKCEAVEKKSLKPAKRRGSLAGPAKKPAFKKSITTPTQGSLTPRSSTAKRLTRQGTFDVTTPLKEKSNGNHRGTPQLPLKRQGTFDVEQSQKKPAQTLRRQGTFNIETEENILPTPVVSKQPNQVSKIRIISPRQTRTSLATPHSSRKSVTRSFISHLVKTGVPATAQSPVSMIPKKQKINSVTQEINQRSAAVSQIRESSGKKIPVRSKQAPDFGAMHNKIFDKMESLVDSRRKIIQKANSIQKTAPRCANLPSRHVPVNGHVARKLISPKFGKSRIPSPKLIPKPVATPKTNVSLSAKKKHSVGKMVAGISRLSSPRFNMASASHASSQTKMSSTTNRFGFNLAAPNRREILKEVVSKVPINKCDHTQKSRQMLKSVRLNKRFELQMKHRLNQQNSTA